MLYMFCLLRTTIYEMCKHSYFIETKTESLKTITIYNTWLGSCFGELEVPKALWLLAIVIFVLPMSGSISGTRFVLNKVMYLTS